MAQEHNVITDPEIHEPKGCAAASAGEVYVADGAASGDWTAQPGATYGGIYSNDASIAIASIGTTAKALAAFDTNMPSYNITVSHTSDNITVIQSGDYSICFQITFATSAAGDAGEYQFHLRVDGVENYMSCRREMSGSTDTGSASFSGIVSLTAAEVLTVYIESDNGGDTDDIVVESAQFCTTLLKAS